MPHSITDEHPAAAAVAGAALAMAIAMPTLRHSSDDVPGIRRVRHGRGFSYRWPDGRAVADPRAIARIRSLAIPPAWTDVWISPHANGHVQATGRDARRRKQHRYHPRWTAVRDAAKYERLLAFGRALPRLRRRIAVDLAVPGLPHRRVVALVVALLDRTLMRVGNDEYARTNGSYGLTTLTDRHARIAGSTLRFRFRGKSGITHDVDLADRRLARLVKQCQELPGSQLFQYVDEAGRVRDLTSGDVNQYLRTHMGEAFTAKDFRTWAGTVLAAEALAALERSPDHRPGEAVVRRAVEEVARQLGNTRTVCRKCYIHPRVIDAYLDGGLRRVLGARVRRRLTDRRAGAGAEGAVLRLLARRLSPRRRAARSR